MGGGRKHKGFEMMSKWLPSWKVVRRVLFYTIPIGVGLMSLGIFLMGRGFGWVGSRILILGSGIFYISVILFVFLLD
jgi:hypothetical protein